MTTTTVIDSAKALCVHGALLWAATAWSGFLMMVDGPNPKLLLVAHTKGFLHSFTMFGFGMASYAGCFPNLSPATARVAFWLIVTGSWLSLVGDTHAAWLNKTLPLAAEKTGAEEDEDCPNSQLLVLATLAMSVGTIFMISGVDFGLVCGGPASGKKLK